MKVRKLQYLNLYLACFAVAWAINGLAGPPWTRTDMHVAGMLGAAVPIFGVSALFRRTCGVVAAYGAMLLMGYVTYLGIMQHHR